MNYKELDRFLRDLTQEEAQNLSSQNKKVDYTNLRKANVNGRLIPLLNRAHIGAFPDHEHFMIIENARYQEVPEHVHEWIEIAYVYSGTCHQTINNTPYHLLKGQICLIDTRVPHSVNSCGEEDLLINLLFSKEYFNSNFLSRFSGHSLMSEFIISAISEKTLSDKYIIFQSTENEHLSMLMKELMCEYYEPSLNSTDVLNAFLALIFLELMRMEEQNMLLSNMTEKAYSLHKVLGHIDRNYLSTSLTETAQLFSLNPSYLSTLLKEESGYSFGELLRKAKINHAKRLLLSSDLSVTEIAHLCGYENMSFFYHIFEKETNKRPAEFRKVYSNIYL
ncbi:MAG: AraC family transcriptional regulator [Lachnospiraceae bacterium]